MKRFLCESPYRYIKMDCFIALNNPKPVLISCVVFLDAQAGTFYFVGVTMGVCQLLSLLELFHIADGFEECRLFPRFMQVKFKDHIHSTIISSNSTLLFMYCYC